MRQLDVVRRAQRLLPAGLQAIGLLPLTCERWEASALAGMRLARSPHRGMLGLRLHPLPVGPAGTIGVADIGAAPDPAGYGPWRMLSRSQGLYWVDAMQDGRAVLVDVPQARAWLLWHDREVRAWQPH